LVSQFAAVDSAVSPTLLDSLLELDQTVLDALPIGVYACDIAGASCGSTARRPSCGAVRPG
jgi:hypothetical protein